MDKDIKNPRVTVFIPLYNNEKYVAQTIESVLTQTYQDFEVLVIDDGSTDKSVEIVHSFKDPRIRLIHNNTNRGLVYTRNRGLDETRTEYIALIDSDDIFYQTKLEKQINFLEAHPDFALVGTWTELIDSNGVKTGVAWKNKFSPEQIPIILLFHNCFTQSSIVMKMQALEGMYYRSPDTDEDYDLWMRLAEKWRVWNIPEVLTQYRTHPSGISKKPMIKSFVDTEIKKELQSFGIDISPEEFAIHKTNYTYKNPDIKDFIWKRESWLKKLKTANRYVKCFPEQIFNEVMSERWLTSCSANGYVGFWMWKTFWKSDLSQEILRINFLSVIKFFIKCLVKKQ